MKKTKKVKKVMLIYQFEENLKGIENVFWNGPLGAYDHSLCSSYAEGSLEIAKLLFRKALLDPNLSIWKCF